MREFFKGWQRKVGCVLLVIALVLTGLWILSHFFQDFAGREESHFIVISQDGAFSWSWRHRFVAQGPGIHWGSYTHPKYLRPLLPTSGRHYSHPNGAIQYWWLVLPLTLLSAYLILWKPRQKPKDVPLVVTPDKA